MIRIAIILAACTIGSITDLKKREIPDWLTYSLMLLGIALNIAAQQYWGIVLGAAVFVLGLIANRFLRYGGGDAKLLAGIGFSSNPLFFLNTFVIASAAFLCFYLLKFRGQVTNKKKPFVPFILFGAIITNLILYIPLNLPLVECLELPI